MGTFDNVGKIAKYVVGVTLTAYSALFLATAKPANATGLPPGEAERLNNPVEYNKMVKQGELQKRLEDLGIEYRGGVHFALDEHGNIRKAKANNPDDGNQQNIDARVVNASSNPDGTKPIAARADDNYERDNGGNPRVLRYAKASNPTNNTGNRHSKAYEIFLGDWSIDEAIKQARREGSVAPLGKAIFYYGPDYVRDMLIKFPAGLLYFAPKKAYNDSKGIDGPARYLSLPFMYLKVLGEGTYHQIKNNPLETIAHAVTTWALLKAFIKDKEPSPRREVKLPEPPKSPEPAIAEPVIPEPVIPEPITPVKPVTPRPTPPFPKPEPTPPTPPFPKPEPTPPTPPFPKPELKPPVAPFVEPPPVAGGLEGVVGEAMAEGVLIDAIEAGVPTLY